MEWLLSRTVVVGLAVLGGIFAVIASVSKTRPGSSPSRVRQWNMLAYIFMGASVLLFIIVGFPGAGS